MVDTGLYEEVPCNAKGPASGAFCKTIKNTLSENIS